MITKKIAREIVRHSKKAKFWERVIVKNNETNNAVGSFLCLQRRKWKERKRDPENPEKRRQATVAAYLDSEEEEKRLAKIDRIHSSRGTKKYQLDETRLRRRCRLEARLERSANDYV